MRQIDADALFPYGAVPFVENDGFLTADKLYGIIKNAPTIDPETLRPTGRWVHLFGDEWCCTNCGFVISTEGSWEKPEKKFCEECGAKMEG